MTTEEMVREWIDLDLAIKEQVQDLERLEYAIQLAMEKDGATEYAHPTHTVKLENGRPTWDYGKLKGVLEYVDSQDLYRAGAWAPEHTEEVLIKEKWNATKLKPFGRRGKEIRQVIEDARIPGRAHLKIRPKEDSHAATE
jgi:hypothetical protein